MQDSKLQFEAREIIKQGSYELMFRSMFKNKGIETPKDIRDEINKRNPDLDEEKLYAVVLAYILWRDKDYDKIR